MALGSSASGWLIDTFGASSGFWVSVAGGAVALVIALLGYRSLSGEARSVAACDAAA